MTLAPVAAADIANFETGQWYINVSSSVFTTGGTFNAMVNQPTVEQPNLDFVTPSDPNDSYLFQKLLGSPGISGGRMPLNGPYLSDAQITAVEAWISAAALNN